MIEMNPLPALTAPSDFFTIVQWLILAYFVLLNASYLVLNLLSLAILRRQAQEQVLDSLPQVYSGLELPVSILVPVCNEAAGIAALVHSLLGLSYSEFEIIVINDGSTDATLDILTREFALLPFPEAYRVRWETQALRQVYRSTRYANLRVIDKHNGGKADAMNAGINAARFPLFCGVDAGSILQANSLQLLVKPFLDDTTVVAAGGTVRIANGSEIKDGLISKVSLSLNFWTLFQVVEYLRAYLFGRLGWSSMNGMLILSGAFALFRKETVVHVGAYRTDTLNPDMDLVVRLHRMLRQQGRLYRVVFVPEPVCWTDAPVDMRTIKDKRMRWQRGLSESLMDNLGLLFSRNGGVPGWLAFPFMLLFEWIGPLIELGGYCFMLYAFLIGAVTGQAFAVFTFLAIGMGILLSASGLLLDEMSFHPYPKKRHLVWLAVAVVAENLGYRQLSAFWRLLGLFKWSLPVKVRSDD